MHSVRRLLLVSLGLAAMAAGGDAPADLVLRNGAVYTMDSSHPWATGVAITGNRIVAVLGDDSQAAAFVGPKTRVVDLAGRFLLPGFIDGHIHFNSAGALVQDVNLMTVADDGGLRKEVGRVTALVGPGEWLTGGLWGAYEQWALGAEKASGARAQRWKPNRKTIDDLTPRNPCLLTSFDSRLYLANTAALEAAGLVATPAEGLERDGSGLTGIVLPDSPALARLRKAVKPKSHDRLLAENRAALRRLAESGIVEVHDITTPDQAERFVELQRAGDLTCRVWMRPDLSRGAELKASGLTMGVHPVSRKRDHYLRYGALKGYIDGIMGTHGALFFQPYDDQPGNAGHYRPHTSDDPRLAVPNMEKMYGLIKTGIDAGFVTNVHAIGDKGVALMLDTYERLMKDLGRDLEGFRVIHAQVIRPSDFGRFRQLHVIAEVNPYHVSDDMRWMEERIGHERCKGAYAFQTLIDSGAMLSFGSDWPGTSAAEYHVHPKYLIHAAVTRTTLTGTPAGGWFPEQRIAMAEALKAYTINNAIAAFDGDLRGSIAPGKLADLTLCDRNLMRIDPADILKMNVDMTIVDGKIVFERR
ncbi:MAG TPA: amidohydrolase [Vicinamibacterales bacterium]|nr:amidohydrolase [Vicinamibacterales bacterium]